MGKTKGSFTLPGEAGYEKLTLEIANKWGADVIRDSDGTELSPEILEMGYDIYSTVCVIREHNEWLNNHPGNYQQTFLMSKPVMSKETCLSIDILDGFFTEQFVINDTEDSLKYWEVYDRTANKKIDDCEWKYNHDAKTVTINNCEPYHSYTVNFFAYRVWEEISMYNHVTNNWDKEHLAPLDPRSDEARAYLIDWMKQWCENHPNTNVVRFTSLFYNFVWIWGSNKDNSNLYTDWGSYDFTVSPKALDDFEKEYGYRLCSEDFINGGKLHVTHMPATQKQLDYMDFTQKYVATLGKELVDIVKGYGKKAYVFYDDSWVGLEPYGPYFKSIGFDGLIKCVFNGYEARLCAGVDIDVHELRLHPYLFPVGLGGKPTFMEGGEPTKDAQEYWVNVRRALLRKKIDRLGLGGYLHLMKDFPDFIDYIESLLDEFRMIKEYHEKDAVYTMPITVAVLHSWGSIRSWSLSGHFHETYMHTLIHINEALSGLPVMVKFVNFEDVKKGGLEDAHVVINAGREMSAWSGGEAWDDVEVKEAMVKWVAEGGIYIGVKQPSATNCGCTKFNMAEVMGIDEDDGSYVCHGKSLVSLDDDFAKKVIVDNADLGYKKYLRIIGDNVSVLSVKDDAPNLTVNRFGEGYGVYMADFTYTEANVRTLFNLIVELTKCNIDRNYVADDARVDCAYFMESKMMIVCNHSAEKVKTFINVPDKKIEVEIEPYGITTVHA